MIISAMIRECDWTDQKFDQPVMGYHSFSRGATGRVCHVFNLCAEAVDLEKTKVYTYEEVEAWAESVPGGYLDY